MTLHTIYPPIPDAAVLIDPLLVRLGYTDSGSAPSHVKDRAQQALDRVLRTACPAGTVYCTPVKDVSHGEIHGEGLTLESILWAAFAGKAESPLALMAFALTLGPGPDEDAQGCGSVSLAYFRHEAGSVVIEKTADLWVQDMAGHKQHQGLQPSRRFSPGYCDIPLETHKAMFRVLQPEKVGIRLHDSGALTPIKSITAAVLFSPKLPAPSPCHACRNIRCTHRRIDDVN